MCRRKDVRSWLVSPLSLKLRASLTTDISSRWPSRAAPDAYDAIVRRYYGFVRLKASSYFLAGGDSRGSDPGGPGRPLQGGARLPHRPRVELPQLRGALHHAPDHHRGEDRDPQQAHAAQPATCRSRPRPAGGVGDSEPTLDEMLPGPTAHDPVNQVISSEELRALVACLSTVLSELESRVLGALPRRPLLRGDRRARWGATARRSTTRCSASSARWPPTSTRAPSRPEPRGRPGVGSLPAMSTITVIIIVGVLLVIVLAIGGMIVVARRREAGEAGFEASLEEVNRQLAAAHAQDKGWEPAACSAAARRAFADQRAGRRGPRGVAHRCHRPSGHGRGPCRVPLRDRRGHLPPHARPGRAANGPSWAWSEPRPRRKSRGRCSGSYGGHRGSGRASGARPGSVRPSLTPL